ncbi:MULTISPECIES: VOC family protein [Winogradskyella]|uniref:VOC family protein n=1 Tax=Winogradskyella ouciana TaxID=2608631 RepID=A0A7K1G954_9FLAO|nr:MULTISPECIES: VOC family protein [Winogradskyella]MBO6881373.1 VOC family protein [Winogradskyella sp.]MTE25681.1 VOC family protein [Winogradskyella ouciana]
MKVQPYLAFKGDCKNALEHYQSILGGNIVNEQTYNDVEADIPGSYRNKLQHAELKGDGFHIMAYDASPDTPLTNGTNINMSIDAESKDKAKDIFNKLSQGGTIHTPFQEMSWDACYGRCSDKYNVSWMVNYKKQG